MNRSLITIFSLLLISACDPSTNNEPTPDNVRVDNLTAGHYVGSTLDANGNISAAYGFYSPNGKGFVFTVDNDNDRASRVYLKHEYWQSNSDEGIQFSRVDDWQVSHLAIETAIGHYRVWHDDIGPLDIEINAQGAIALSGRNGCFGVGMLGDNIGSGLSLELHLERCGNERDFQGLIWQVNEPGMKQLRLVSFSENEVNDWYLQ